MSLKPGVNGNNFSSPQIDEGTINTMKTLKRLVCLGVLLGSGSGAMAHDFWLEPGDYYSKEATAVPVKFKVGHEDNAGNWNLSWDKIVALRTYSSTGVQDMAASIIPKSNLMPGVAKTQKLSSGTYVIGFESYHSLSSLEANTFNAYAREEGLADVLAHRQKNGLTTKAGTELFSRKAKAIIQIGSALSDIATKPLGHTLEIVPIQHPAKINSEGTFPVKVLFKGKPLENALVDAAPLSGASHKEQSKTTDNRGEVIFELSGDGAVKLNVVWGEVRPNNTEADYESYFSSLTFMVGAP